MATLGGESLTLIDVTRQYGKDTDNAIIAPLLAQYCPVIEDQPWFEANATTEHIMLVDDALPNVDFGVYGEGVSGSKATYQKIKEGMGFIEGLFQPDVNTLKLAKDPTKAKFHQAKKFFEAMAYKYERTFFYGSLINQPNGFKGLANRYNSRSGDIGDNFVHGGGSGNDNTSIYIVTWSEADTYGIYPLGAKPGINKEDWGETSKTLPNGKTLRVDETYFKMDCGLAVNNWKNNVRIGNIDVSDLSTGSAAAIVDLIREGVSRLQHEPSGFTPITKMGYEDSSAGLPSQRTAIYMNKTLYTMMEKQANKITENQLTMGNAYGVQYPRFRDIPIRISSTILNTEATVP